MEGRIRVGISGWTYGPWRGTFYPKDLPRKAELPYAASRLGSIEINGTFYSLQRPAVYERWHDAVPEGRVFAVKGPRYLTHIRRLREPHVPLANFFASGVLLLKRKLGPILWQLPPSFTFDRARLEAFLAILPHDTRQAATLAQGHDAWLSGRAGFRVDEKRPLRHALEVRHESFRDPDFFDLLRKYDVALVSADSGGKWPYFEEMTSDFAYARLHGDKKLYASGYTPAALDRWAEKTAAWAKAGRDAFVYFDNDVKVRSPYDAMSLAHRLGLERGEPELALKLIRRRHAATFPPSSRRSLRLRRDRLPAPRTGPQPSLHDDPGRPPGV